MSQLSLIGFNWRKDGSPSKGYRRFRLQETGLEQFPGHGVLM